MTKKSFKKKDLAVDTTGPKNLTAWEYKNQKDVSDAKILFQILSIQCSLADADEGVILNISDDGNVKILALFPKNEVPDTPPSWIKHSLQSHEEAVKAEIPIIKPFHQPDDLYGQPVNKSLIILPFNVTVTGKNLLALIIPGGRRQELDLKTQRLIDSIKLLMLSNFLSTQRKAKESLDKLTKAMHLISVLNQQEKFQGAAMVLCNTMGSQWGCELVSIGFIKGKYIQLKAMSHTEHFIRKMQLVQDIEAAMEECADQDGEIIYPAAKDSTYVTRATESLSKRHGPFNILSLPIRRGQDIIAVITLKRPPEKPFLLDEIETIRLSCELCSARLIELYKNNQWIPAIAGEKWHRLAHKLLEPRHTAVKIVAILVFTFILFIFFGKGTYKANAPFVVEATYQQVIPAPFDGFIKTVEVEPGDKVEAGKTILASLDKVELRLQLVQAKADKMAYLKQASASMRDGETAQAQIAQANADKAEAQIKLLSYLIGQANLNSPITGTVVKGDLKKEIGAPVKTGDILFEVTPLESLRAELMISEEQIFDIEVGQKGYLATFSYPSQYIEFEVERINPIAEVINQRNVFKVRVRLLKTFPWLRPGMEGVAKVNIDKRAYIWIWTRKVVNWLRMKLWI